MPSTIASRVCLAPLALALLLVRSGEARPVDPLPSWVDGPSKRAITTFVEAVSTPGSGQFVPPAERIATFDNDGTLWAERPFYVQGLFALDRVRTLAPANPHWRGQEPFASVLRGDPHGALAGGEAALAALITATHAQLSTDEFDQLVRDWIRTARHPDTGRSYTEMVYQPMLELLAYLRRRDFKTFVVSGGGVDFMRPWVEQTYGIPPEQVIGSSLQTRFALRDGKPVLIRLPELRVLNDGASKPVSIQHHIGRRPIAAFGNSDGDLAMLQWTMAGSGPRFALLVHHTDGQREWAYDRDSGVGRLDRALVEARALGWTVVDMRRDWRVVFPSPVPGE
jgi:phosphoglycolate phosphatase-like HAD superfamily hydrolase